MKFMAQNKTGSLHAHCKLHHSLCTHHLVQTTWFVYLSSVNSLFLILPTSGLMMHAIKEQNIDTLTNNHSNNLDIGDVDDLWVIK